MSIMTILSGIPLYTTKKEALVWALANGVKGYHTHKHKNKIGYMGGATHSTATRVSLAKPINTIQQTIAPTPQMNQDQQTPVEPLQPTRPQPITQPVRATEPIRRTTPVRTTTPVRRTSSGGGGGGGGY